MCHLAYKSNTSRFLPAPCGKVAAQGQNIASDASAVAKFSTRVYIESYSCTIVTIIMYSNFLVPGTAVTLLNSLYTRYGRTNLVHTASIVECAREIHAAPQCTSHYVRPLTANWLTQL